MSDFGTMQARIANELHRGDISASSSVVTNAIQTAIDFYETRRFYFNEATDETIYTSNAEPFLSSVPSDIVRLDSLKVAIGTRDYPLSPRDYEYIDRIDSGQWEGYPEIYAWYKDTIRIYPIPNGNYQLTFSYVKRLSDLSADATTNSWMTVGEKMIRSRAKGEIFLHYLRNPKMADVMYLEAEAARLSINRETEGRIFSGRLRPTEY